VANRLDAPENEMAALKKINRVLMERVERSVNSSGSDFSIFEQNILLQKNVDERTAELEDVNHRLRELLEENKKNQELLRAGTERAERQREAIAGLVLDDAVAKTDMAAAMKRITEVVAEALKVRRVGVWTLEEDGSVLYCLSVYEADLKRHSEGLSRKIVDFPSYFKAIFSENRIYAEDVLTDSRTSDLAEGYFIPLGISSVLDAGILIDGRPKGVICIEHTGSPRKWQPDEQSFASTIASLAAQIFSNHERRKAVTALRENRRLLADLIENSGTLIVIKDWQGVYQLVNSRWEQITGVSREEAMGKTDYDLFPFETADRFRKNDIEVIETGTVVEKEEILETRDGVRHFIANKFSFSDETGTTGVICGIITEITDRKRSEEALRESERMYAALLNNLPGFSYRCRNDRNWTMEFISEGCLSITGYAPDDLINNKKIAYNDIIHPDQQRHVWKAYQDSYPARKHVEVEYPIITASGEIRWVWERGQGVFDAKENLLGLEGFITDITERKNAEEESEKLQAQLAQAQKLESVGRLAGGVAHDFNNMLGVILGHCEMALMRLKPGEKLYADISEIGNAAKRSAELTRQLLGFARKQTVTPVVLDLNKTIEALLGMLRRLIGEDIELKWLPDTNLKPVKIDRSQVDQIMANLCVNARDAIACVGRMTIETGNACFTESYCNCHAGFIPGDYVMVAVSDNGCGMDSDTLSRIFEPFFTTKDFGKGTGLGLAMIYGIVKQNGGFINVYSEPGEGSVFKVYFPVHEGKSAGLKHKNSPVDHLTGNETILVVEDEPMILNLAKTMLEHSGYKVLPAMSPGEAIETAEKHEGEIRLLITDVIMPEMNGRELAKRILAIYPDVKRLFMSGYTANVIAHHGVLDKGVHFLQKPFSFKDFTDKIREAIES